MIGLDSDQSTVVSERRRAEVAQEKKKKKKVKMNRKAIPGGRGKGVGEDDPSARVMTAEVESFARGEEEIRRIPDQIEISTLLW